MNTFKCWLVAQIEPLFGFTLIAGWMILLGADQITSPPEFLISIWFFVTIASIALIPSIIITIFTWRNYEEVISRSLMWRRSNIDRFSMKLKYSFGVFIQTLLILIIIPYSVIILVLNPAL